MELAYFLISFPKVLMAYFSLSSFLQTIFEFMPDHIQSNPTMLSDSSYRKALSKRFGKLASELLGPLHFH